MTMTLTVTFENCTGKLKKWSDNGEILKLKKQVDKYINLKYFVDKGLNVDIGISKTPELKLSHTITGPTLTADITGIFIYMKHTTMQLNIAGFTTIVKYGDMMSDVLYGEYLTNITKKRYAAVKGYN